MAKEIDEISQHDVNARNSLWKKISKNVSQSKIGSFARAVSSAFENLKFCQSGSEKKKRIVRDNGYSEEVIPSAPIEFVYPGDRYLSNAEIQKQLEIIEERFNKQSEIINRFKDEYSNMTKANHVKSMPSIGDLTTTTSKRFETIENLVKQIQQSRQDKENKAFGKAVRNAFGRLMNRGRKVESSEGDDGCFEEVTLPTPIEFVYPVDRYLSNAETLKHLEVIEERFNRQSQILNKYKEKFTESARANYVKETSITCDTSDNAMATEKRFAAIENLVKQIQDRRKQIENKRCAIPGFDNDTYAVQDDYHSKLINETIPPPDDDNLKYDQCHLFPINASNYDNYSRPINVSKYKCNKWVFDKTVFHENIVTEMSVVCDKEILQSIAKMTFFIGVLFGDFFAGMASDRFGRKTTFCLAVVLLLISTTVLYWAENLVEYFIIRFFIGAACASIFLVGFVIGMEMVGPSKREWAGTFWQTWFAIGLVILAGVAYLLRDWRKLQLAMSVPTAIYLCYYWVIPESPRWLLSQGRTEEAEAILRKAAKVNKVTLPENFISDCDPGTDTGKVWHLFRSKRLARRTLIIFFNWIVIAMVYYGLSLNTGNLGGDFYLNFLLQGLSEFPAYVICLLFFDRLGRKKLHLFFMLMGGGSCIATLFTRIYGKEKLEAATITLAMVGKMCVAGAFTVIYVFSAELFPTVVRNSGVGTSSSLSRFGVISAPYIAGLNTTIKGDFGRALPLVIFGSFSLLAGILALSLPETANTTLPETIEDAENFPKQTSQKRSKGGTLTGSTTRSYETLQEDKTM